MADMKPVNVDSLLEGLGWPSPGKIEPSPVMAQYEIFEQAGTFSVRWTDGDGRYRWLGEYEYESSFGQFGWRSYRFASIEDARREVERDKAGDPVDLVPVEVIAADG